MPSVLRDGEKSRRLGRADGTADGAADGALSIELLPPANASEELTIDAAQVTAAALDELGPRTATANAERAERRPPRDAADA